MPDKRLIVALDLPRVDEARRMVDVLDEEASFFKIGHQLAYSPGGFEFAAELAKTHDVFLDLKLLDIANTVEHGVRSVAAMGVSMLTVHAYPQALAAAAKGAEGSDLAILAVTVLTSMDDDDLKEAGYAHDAELLVKRRALQAYDAGVGGIVCSPLEAEAVREIVGPVASVVTPGIRPMGVDGTDQKRIATPYEALESGASHIVVGRPITGAPNPAGAARRILSELTEYDADQEEA